MYLQIIIIVSLRYNEIFQNEIILPQIFTIYGSHTGTCICVYFHREVLRWSVDIIITVLFLQPVSHMHESHVKDNYHKLFMITVTCDSCMWKTGWRKRTVYDNVIVYVYNSYNVGVNTMALTCWI